MGAVRRLLILVFVVAGCGNERTPPPDVVTPAEPQGRRQVLLESAGVRFLAPENWRGVTRAGSLAGGVRSNSATVAVWRYRRSEPLPQTRGQMRRVALLLTDRVRLRDPGFRLRRRTVGRDRITLVGTQDVGDVEVGVRSVHIFKHGAEIVVDAYAPRRYFSSVDQSVFRPLIRSLRVTRPRR